LIQSFTILISAPTHPAFKPLAKFCHKYYSGVMATMNISLPEPLKQFVDAQVESGSFGTSSEYVRTLIRKEKDIETLRELLLEGARSGSGKLIDDAYFDGLRARIAANVTK
jgi:antitoxin ParD1/3/4